MTLSANLTPGTMREKFWLTTLAILFAMLPAAGCLGGGGNSTDPDGFTHKNGSLSSGDDTLTSGEFADDFSLSAQPGQWIEVAMTSSEIDPYVILKPPSCPQAGTCPQQIDNDDLRSGDLRAFVFHNVQEAGPWQILATSSNPGETGSYTLAYRVVDAGTPPATSGVEDVARGFSSSGTLTAGDKTLETGEYTDNYAFFAQPGQSVAIDLTSPDFDPYLILYKPDKTQEDNDDFNGSQQHSRIQTTLFQGGIYRVSVTSFQPGEAGAYTLNISGSAAAPGPPQPGGGQVVPFQKQ